MQEGKTIEQMGLKLSEETGECAQALLSYVDAHGSAYKKLGIEDVMEECADVVLIAVSLYYKLGGDNGTLAKDLQTKMAKWQKNL